MLGERLADQELPSGQLDHVSVKEAVLPFARFAAPTRCSARRMKSTGRLMGIAADFPTAFGKAQAAPASSCPSRLRCSSPSPIPQARRNPAGGALHDLGFEVIATAARPGDLADGVPVTITDGDFGLAARRRPDPPAPCDLVINTPTGSGARADATRSQRAVRQGIPA